MGLSRSLLAVLTATLLTACTAPPSQPPQTPDPAAGPAPAPAAQAAPEGSIIIAAVKAAVAPRQEQQWFKAVAFATPERGWILLGDGALTTTDGGETWRPAGLPQPFDTMTFATAQVGHATVGQQVFRTVDGGTTWAPVDAAGWPNSGASFLDQRHGWSIGLEQGTFFRTRDGGATWEKLPDPCPENSRRPFSFVSPTDGWLLCGFDEGSGAMSKRLFRTGDGGRTWSLVGEALAGRNGAPDKEWPGGLDVGDYVGSLFFVDERHGWYTGLRYGTFMATQDGGQTWQEKAAPPMRYGRLGFISPQVGYRYGIDTMRDSPWVLTMTRDAGESWTQVYPRPRPLQRFYLDAQTYIGELDGDLYRTDDEGATWRFLSKLPGPLRSIYYTSREQGWALMGNHLYRTADGGATWAQAASDLDLADFESVQGLDDQTAVLWDGLNRLLITQDGGASFTAVDAPYGESGGYGFSFTSAETAWFSQNSLLYTTADGAKSWQVVPLPGLWNAEGVTVGPDGRIWASIVDTTSRSTPALLTLASDDGGKTWTRYDLGDFNQPRAVHRCGLSSICVESGGYRHGIVSHDGGQTWLYYER